MAVRIRLRRMGRKKQPHYRIVVADAAAPRDGRIVETLGYYKPLSDPARLVMDLERVDHWMARGAQATVTVRSLIRKARRGGDTAVAVGEPDVEKRRAEEAEQVAARRAAEAKAAEAAEAAAAGATAEATAAPEAEESGAEPAAEEAPEASESAEGTAEEPDEAG